MLQVHIAQTQKSKIIRNAISIKSVEKDKYNSQILKCVDLLGEYETSIEELERLKVSDERKYERISKQLVKLVKKNMEIIAMMKIKEMAREINSIKDVEKLLKPSSKTESEFGFLEQVKPNF